MKIVIAIGIIVFIGIVSYFYESYKYPVYPRCGDNLHSKRVKRNLIRCEIHGLIKLDSKKTRNYK